MFQYTGLASFYHAIRGRPGATILMYHSVPPKDTAGWLDPRNTMELDRFEMQMGYLASNRSVISMDQLVDAIDSNSRLPKNAVVLTFDDGYLDNLTNVAPILARHRLPAVLYLATAYIDRAETQWIDQLYQAFRGATVTRTEINGIGQIDLNDDTTRRRCYLSTASQMLSLDTMTRRAMLDELRDRLGTKSDAPRSTMNWDEVRRLREVHADFEIGAHTHEHVDLSACSDRDAEREIVTSVERIQQELGTMPKHFSFPYGRSDRSKRQIVERLGLRSAVANGSGVRISPVSDRHWMPRIESPRSPALLRYFTSGAYPDLSLALLGRS